jgi:hypothetical protein
LLLGAAVVSVLLVGGCLAHCEGLDDGWGAATRGVLQVGRWWYDPGWPRWYRSNDHVFVRYEVEARACGRETVEVRWFRILLSDLFAAGGRLPRDSFEEHRGEVPDAVRVAARQMRLGEVGPSQWPDDLTAKFGDCVVVNIGGDRIATDCHGKRALVRLPTFFPHYWKEQAWWRYPAMILGFPFALAFDAITIPFNAAVLTIFLLPVVVSELAAHRRLFWRVGLAVAVAYDVTYLLVLPLTGGHAGAGGLGRMIGGVAKVFGTALASAAVPLVAGAVVARETGRSPFVLLGMLGGAVCAIVLVALAFVDESLLDAAESLPALFFNPIALVPGVLAIAIVLLGCMRATPQGDRD